MGLIKAFFWTSNGTTSAKYAVNGCPDKSANGMFSLCRETGMIAAIPATPGLVVWNDGHIGISLDGVWAIEARGFNYGVVKTRIRDRSWKKWGKLPSSMLDYVGESLPSASEEAEAPSVPEGACPYAEPVQTQKKGSRGEGVCWVQWMLTACGYDVGQAGIDGDFGSDTRAAVKAFQTAEKLEPDGIVGRLTRAALKARKAKQQEGEVSATTQADSLDSSETEEEIKVNICPYAEPQENQKKGSRGEGVRWVQWMLTACGFDVGRAGVDGDFGSDTRAAVKAFQTARRLEADGVVGRLTRAALKAALAEQEREKHAEQMREDTSMMSSEEVPPAYVVKGKIADLSKWQGAIDWTAAAQELDFCILRAQYGSEMQDERYLEYAAGCEAMEIPYGAYSYCRFSDEKTAREEARSFVAHVAGTHPLYLVLDLEPDGVKAENIREMVSVYIEELRSQCVERVGLYIAHHAYQAYGIDVSEADFVWIPRYGSNSGAPEKEPDYPCDLWQYTSNGSLSGVKGRVDLNQLMDESRMAWFRGEA